MGLERLEGGRNVLRFPDFEWRNFDPERARRGLDVTDLSHGCGIADVPYDCQSPEPGDELTQQFEPLTCKIGCEERHAGDVTARSRQTFDQANADRIVRNCKDDGDDGSRFL
ncbi:MAG: hypothetical protein WA893_10855 [Xanthobacteraceae bacterium]